jgi:hypothetical protein
MRNNKKNAFEAWEMAVIGILRSNHDVGNRTSKEMIFATPKESLGQKHRKRLREIPCFRG